MNPRFRPVVGLLLASALAVTAQEVASVPSAPSVPSLPPATALPVAPGVPGATAPALFSAEQLDLLLGPVALYPDALLALLLPASTNPSEIVLAARFLAAGRNPADADSQPWDDSVRALVRFPATLRWMDDNLAWTKQLGDTFRAQPEDVMAAVQRLRARALAAGTLFSNAQQQVVVQGNVIEILPALQDIIYVPTYDARVVFLERNAYPPLDATMPYFGLGFSMGPWLSYGLDWPSRRIWVINRTDRDRYWREQRHSRPLPPPPVAFTPQPGTPPPPRWHTWRPDPDRRPPGPPAAPAPRPRIDFPRNEVSRPTAPSGPRFENAPALSGTDMGPTARPAPAPAPAPTTGSVNAITAPAAPAPTPPPVRARPPRESLPTPAAVTGPAAPSAVTPAPTQLSLSPASAPAPAPRPRPSREDRPVNAEPRTRSSPPPTPASTPAPAPAPGPRAAPATTPAPPSAPATTPAEPAERRGKKAPEAT